MQRRITRSTLAALAALALVAASAIAAPKSPNPGKGHPGTGKGHPGIHLGVSKPKGGTTVLTADSGLLTALTNAGVTVAQSANATVSGDVFTFPITGGSIVYKKGNKGKVIGAKKKLLSGYILDAGSGVTFTKGTVSATVSDFRVNLSAGKAGRIDAKVSSGKLKLATLSNVAVNATSKSITATATLTPNAVTDLNGAFGTTLPPSGTLLGTVVITPTF
jgi:hypothetical protein